MLATKLSAYDWTAETLRSGTEAKVHRKLILNCGLTRNEIKYGLDALEAVQEEAIIKAVASPPNEWGITIEERMVMLEFFIQRQQLLLESF